MADDRLQQLPARAPSGGRAVFIEMRHGIGDRRVDVRQAVKGSVTQPPEQPSLDDEHGLSTLALSRAAAARRQNGGSVMRRHFGIGPIDLRIVKAGLDDGGSLSGTSNCGTPPIAWSARTWASIQSGAPASSWRARR